MYVQIGCAANCVALYTKSLLGPGQVAAIWGVGTAVAIYATAALSGGHLNPAVTFGFALVRPADFGFRKLIPYWMAQLFGACLAGLVNLFLFYGTIGHFEKKNGIVRGGASSIESAAAFGDYWSLHSGVTNGVHAFFIEAFGTAVLSFALFALTHNKNPIPGAAVPAIVGAVYGVLVAILGPLTGAALNPARDLGPRLVTVAARWGTVAFTDFLPYLLGPLFGGPIGAFLADKILML